VIATPVYNMNISWKLLTFFNRFRPLHKVFPPDVLSYKAGGAIAVGGTRQGGQATAIQAIHEFFFCRQILVVGGGKGAYSGGTVWSRDDLENGTKLDDIGLETARSVAIRVAHAAKMIRAGQEACAD
jgi:multimeric flavodoxin WrbA